MNSKQLSKLMVIAIAVLVSLGGSPASAEEKVYFVPVVEKATPPKEDTKKQSNSGAAEESAAEESAAEEETAEEETAEESAVEEKPERRAATAVPTFAHVPVHSARAGEPLVIKGLVFAGWRLKRLYVKVYRPDGQTREVDLVRSRKKGLLAVIPGEWVERGGFSYSIASEGTDGVHRDHFASAKSPHVVAMVGYSQAMTGQRQLARFKGHRSQFSVSGNFTAYGSRYADPENLGGDFPKTTTGSDNLWIAKMEYLYRPLRLLHDFRFGIGVMRGSWPKIGETPIHEDEGPGVNYGYGELNFELHRWFSVGGRLILGANAIGFTVGLAGVARIGDIAGTFLSAELETIGGVGSRTDMRFTWRTVPNMPMALGIEFTDWPTPVSGYAPEGANLYYDCAYELGAAKVGLRLGNAKRALSLGGGYQGGLNFSLGF
jgi:hypothetical protein